MMAFYEGLTHSEIAQRMLRPFGTIKAWTRRSLMRLKVCMGVSACIDMNILLLLIKLPLLAREGATAP